MRQFLTNLAKYFVEGLVVAVVAYYIPKKQTDIKSIVLIGVVAALTFALLDYFSPSIGASSRLGAGFGIGSNLVGFGSAGYTPNLPTMPTLTTVGEGFYNIQPAPVVNTSPVPNAAAVPTFATVATDAAGNQVVVNVPVTTQTQPNSYVPANLTAAVQSIPNPTPMEAEGSFVEATGGAYDYDY
jgi:hypothetical protein